MRQGDIWRMEQPHEKSRPVIVVTRTRAIPTLNEIVVVPVTSTLRSIPTCVPVGPAEGLTHDSVAAFDGIRTVSKSALISRIGALDDIGRERMCEALLSVAEC